MFEKPLCLAGKGALLRTARGELQGVAVGPAAALPRWPRVGSSVLAAVCFRGQSCREGSRHPGASLPRLGPAVTLDWE